MGAHLAVVEFLMFGELSSFLYQILWMEFLTPADKVVGRSDPQNIVPWIENIVPRFRIPQNFRSTPKISIYLLFLNPTY